MKGQRCCIKKDGERFQVRGNRPYLIIAEEEFCIYQKLLIVPFVFEPSDDKSRRLVYPHDPIICGFQLLKAQIPTKGTTAFKAVVPQYDSMLSGNHIAPMTRRHAVTSL
jgi:hypothetical protein